MVGERTHCWARRESRAITITLPLQQRLINLSLLECCCAALRASGALSSPSPSSPLACFLLLSVLDFVILTLHLLLVLYLLLNMSHPKLFLSLLGC